MLQLGATRYPSNAAALPLPAGAKRAGELNDRLMKQMDAGPAYHDLWTRAIRANDRGDFDAVEVLLEEARAMVEDNGGAL
jgi:hypothetical protein